MCNKEKKKEEWHSYCGRPASNNEKEKRFFEAMPLRTTSNNARKNDPVKNDELKMIMNTNGSIEYRHSTQRSLRNIEGSPSSRWKVSVQQHWQWCCC